MDSSENIAEKHISVLLNECIEGLNIKPDGVYVDGTLGMGGHSLEIAKRLEGGRLICIDRDGFAIENAKKRIAGYADKITFVHDNFENIPQILLNLGIDGVDGILCDLGVSSPQLDDPERGFSFMKDAALDMRMDRSIGLTAADVVNTYSREQLKYIIGTYGEERFAGRIASGIVSAREKALINTTFELVDIIKANLPAASLREKKHPATRTFQALRIAVNDELGCVEALMKAAPDCLNIGGRLCIISFHSLEDRIVKQGIHTRERGCTCPREAPVCTCGFIQTLKSISGKPILPSDEELERNIRSRSAKLRIAERV